MKSPNHLWTFQYPNGDKAQIDYILLRKKWRNSVQDSRSYFSFSSVSSGHRIVSCKVKLSLRASKPSKPNLLKGIDWKATASNSDICNRFTTEVYNRFSNLFVEDLNKDNIEVAYSHLISTTEKVALEQVPRNKKRNHYEFTHSPTVTIARENLQLASARYNAAPTRRRKSDLDSAKAKLDEAYLNAEVDFINGKINSLSDHFSRNSHSNAWNIVKELSGKCHLSNSRVAHLRNE